MAERDVSSAAWRAFDEAIETSIAGEPRYPSGATFINADEPELGNAIKRAVSEGAPMVVAYTDGTTLVLRGERVHR